MALTLCAAPNDSDIDEVKARCSPELAVGRTRPAVDRDWFVATALTIRDRIMHRWLASERESRAKGRKRVYPAPVIIGASFRRCCATRSDQIVPRRVGDLGAISTR
jgi:hypothetical protein